jgi:glycosyltransferase involved in cell wall biosynthesis
MPGCRKEDLEMGPVTNKNILLASYSGRFAGMERRLVEEARYLTDAGATVTVATRQFPDRPLLDAALNQIGVPVRELDPPPFLSDWSRRRRNRLKVSWYRPKWLLAGEFDAARVLMPWANRGLEIIWLLSRMNVPIIVSAHNAFPGTPMLSRWHSHYLLQAFKNVLGVVGLTESALMRFRGSFGPYLGVNVVQRVVHNAVDTGKFFPSKAAYDAFREWIGVNQQTKVVGSVGRLSNHKRPSDLIYAFKIVYREFPDTRFVLVGDGELRKELEDLVRREGLEGIVILLGEQPSVEKIMAGLDVHVLLSKVEGFASVNVEAMASEVPVVATDVPGSNEVILHERTGYLVEVGDIQGAADKVLRLLSDAENANAMGRDARRWVEQRFSIERRRVDLLDVYQEVMNIVEAGRSDIQLSG